MVIGREGAQVEFTWSLLFALGQENISGWKMCVSLLEQHYDVIYIVVSHVIISAQSNRTFQFLFLLYIYY